MRVPPTRSGLDEDDLVTRQLVDLVLNEGKWLPASMGLAVACAAILLYRHRHEEVPARRRILAAMNLMFAVTIGSMAFGHLLAVTTKLAIGTLEGSRLAFYAIGIALAVPSSWLALHARALLARDADERKTIALNVWLAITLLVLGVPNLPLAAPALFNIGYQLHSRRIVGWAIVAVLLALQLGLFAASLVFSASGRTFEEYSGIED